jgi:hypothetical protein
MEEHDTHNVLGLQKQSITTFAMESQKMCVCAMNKRAVVYDIIVIHLLS